MTTQEWASRANSAIDETLHRLAAGARGAAPVPGPIRLHTAAPTETAPSMSGNARLGCLPELGYAACGGSAPAGIEANVEQVVEGGLGTAALIAGCMFAVAWIPTCTCSRTARRFNDRNTVGAAWHGLFRAGSLNAPGPGPTMWLLARLCVFLALILDGTRLVINAAGWQSAELRNMANADSAWGNSSLARRGAPDDEVAVVVTTGAVVSSMLMLGGLSQATAIALLAADAIRVSTELLQWHRQIRSRAMARVQNAMSKQLGHKLSDEHAESAMDDRLLPPLHGFVYHAVSRQSLGGVLVWLAVMWFAVLVADISGTIDISACISKALRRGSLGWCSATTASDQEMEFPSNVANSMMVINSAILLGLAVPVWKALLVVVASATSRARRTMRAVADKTKHRARVAVDASAVRSTLLQIAARHRGLHIAPPVATAIATAVLAGHQQPPVGVTAEQQVTQPEHPSWGRKGFQNVAPASGDNRPAVRDGPRHRADLFEDGAGETSTPAFARQLEDRAMAPRRRSGSNSSGSIIWGSVASSLPDSDESSVGAAPSALPGQANNPPQGSHAADDASSAVTWTDTASIAGPSLLSPSLGRRGARSPAQALLMTDPTDDRVGGLTIPTKQGRLEEAEKRYRKWFHAMKRVRSQWLLLPMLCVATMAPPLVRVSVPAGVVGWCRIATVIIGLCATLGLAHIATGKAGWARMRPWMHKQIRSLFTQQVIVPIASSEPLGFQSGALVSPPVVVVHAPAKHEPYGGATGRHASKGSLRKSTPTIWLTDQDLVDAIARHLGLGDSAVDTQPQTSSIAPETKTSPTMSRRRASVPPTQVADEQGTFAPMQLDDNA